MIFDYEILFTHCWNGETPISASDEGRKAKDIEWLSDELKDDDLLEKYGDYTLVSARVGEFDGDDEIYAYLRLKKD